MMMKYGGLALVTGLLISACGTTPTMTTAPQAAPQLAQTQVATAPAATTDKNYKAQFIPGGPVTYAACNPPGLGGFYPGAYCDNPNWWAGAFYRPFVPKPVVGSIWIDSCPGCLAPPPVAPPIAPPIAQPMPPQPQPQPQPEPEPPRKGKNHNGGQQPMPQQPMQPTPGEQPVTPMPIGGGNGGNGMGYGY